jgi:DNA-binding helix-hairpin-helix protein with protein kinase domain
MNTFFTSTGKSIQVGKELGKGGEGSVYELPATPHRVAKLYNTNHQPDAQKQAKLRFMAATANKELLNYVAWPEETLHSTPNGSVVGFLMSKVCGRAPIHMLYSPAHRRKDYPDKAWDFLLFAARNTAAASAAIHRHGHVVGDVNQGNVLVGAESRVVLIDADSFQINANGTTHLCKVGVAHFTPPELQGVQSFDRVPRTVNHDNFGLALLIFHLLFGGRHPYSGVARMAEAGQVLEHDIRNFRYAYAPDGKQRGFNPPPKTIPISVVPESIQSMFTLAFTESGAKGARPTAQQWVTALDSLRGQLKRCAETPMHVYPAQRKSCPWCLLEKKGVVYFLDVHVKVAPAGNAIFVLARAWAAIENIPPPAAILNPDTPTIAGKPTPLPISIKNLRRMANVWKIVIASISFRILATLPEASFFVLGWALWAWAVAGNLGGKKHKDERTNRQAALDAAILDHKRFGARFPYLLIDRNKFYEKKKDLVILRDEYQSLPELEKEELNDLHLTAEKRQKHQFLDSIFIDAATIPGVGPAKKAALLSYGIETAADVTWDKVFAVCGFGEALTKTIVDWKKSCEIKFVFNSKNTVTEYDKNTVRAKFAARKQTIENILRRGASELRSIQIDVDKEINLFNSGLQTANRNLIQAQADISVF